MWGNKTIGDPGFRPVFYFLLGLTQPQRDMRWLHRLLHHHSQFLPQLLQVHLMAQGSTKSGKRPDRVILTPEEAAINNALNTMAQGLKEDRNG
jgi:hypothetical protein